MYSDLSTQKRKAQNRAAQRAFRERKERHLKDLETKVEDLEKSSEAANHENGRLRAQVDKLNTELTEYRKRLSLNSTGASYSPPAPPRRNHSASNNDFSYVFPKFGDLPGASFLNNGSLARTSSSSQAQIPATAPPVRTNTFNPSSTIAPSNGNMPLTPPRDVTGSMSPSANGFITYKDSDLNSLTGLFSPSVLDTASRSSSDYFPLDSGSSNSTNLRQGSFGSPAPLNQNSRSHRQPSASATNSPASTMSHAGLNSSAGTTPEASADSPGNGYDADKLTNGLNPIKEEVIPQNSGKASRCSILTTA